MHVVATAGHVDHGKSTLVHALTGMQPDRWAEERRRGMTIDLGFAWTTLPSGRTVAFVDVPGHARFVANMLAGVGPVPAVMFVVAADEGWRQQSEEHLRALDALGVAHGLLVVARADLADPTAAREESLARLADSSLGRVAAVAVSAVQGSGLAQLRGALDDLLATLPPSRTDGPVRLWVDRAFAVRGAGTVVTGTLAAGRIATGDLLHRVPDPRAGGGDREVRVRSLQTLQQPVTEALAVARVAVNLRGVDAADVPRGTALVTPDAWTVTLQPDVRTTLPVRSLPATLTLHIGSAAVPAHVRPLGPDTARLRLAHPLPLWPGDRGLLRDPSRHDLACGVLVLDVLPPPLRRRGSAQERAVELAGLAGPVDPVAEVRRRGAVPARTLAAMGAPPPTSGVVRCGEWLVSPQQWETWRAGLDAAVAADLAADPLSAGLPVGAAARALGLPDARLVHALVEASPRIRHDGGRLRPADAVPQLPAPLHELAGRLAGAPLDAPDAATLESLGLSARELAAATRTGLLLRLADGVYVHPSAPAHALRRLAELEGPFTAAVARERLGTTRRVLIPLLEYLDRQGRTRRVDPQHRVLVRDVP